MLIVLSFLDLSWLSLDSYECDADAVMLVILWEGPQEQLGSESVCGWGRRKAYVWSGPRGD